MDSIEKVASLLTVLLLFGISAVPAAAQQESGYEIHVRDNGTVVETNRIGNTTYRTTTTTDGTVYRSERTQIGDMTFYEGRSSDGWSFEGSSMDIGSMSTSDTDYYDSTGSFTGSSETTTFDFGDYSTTTYEGFDGSNYSYEVETEYDYDVDY